MKFYTRVALALNLVLCLNLPVSAVDKEIVNTDSSQTLTNKTITSPVLGGNVTGTYTLAGTPTYTGGTFNNSTLSLPTITDQLSLADGAVGAPSVRFTNSTTTGLYRIGVDRLGLATAGTNALEISASQNFIIPTGKTLTVGSNVLFGSVADKLNAQYLAIASQAIGDLLCADSTTTFSRLVDIATTNVLRSGGVGACPVYGKVVLTTDVTGSLPQANGGTALSSTGTANQVLGENAAANALEYKTLTAGNGIAIAQSAGAVTFSAPLRSYLAGLGMSTAGGSGTMTVAAGQATDSTQATLINLASAISKSTSAWAAGNNNGGLDTGAIANTTWYHFYVCSGSVGTDVFFSLQPVAGGGGTPTAPATCNTYRRIGAAKTDGSAHWTAFIQDGDYFRWSASVMDVNVTNPGTAALTSNLTVPTGVNVVALINVGLNISATGGVLYISDTASTDEAPSSTAAPLGQLDANIASIYLMTGYSVRVNQSAQFRYRISGSDGNTIIRIVSVAWYDRRGRDN